MGEFQLLLDCGERGKGSSLLRYCPWCGGTLPKSKRGTFFTDPTEADMASVSERMECVKSVAQMYDVLGEPSERIVSEERTQYNYEHLYDSLVLVIFKYKAPITEMQETDHLRGLWKGKGIGGSVGDAARFPDHNS